MLSILDLDDDCLINIFQFLSIFELIEVEKVCQTFKSTCEATYASKMFHNMRIELRVLRTEYLKDIFERVGNTMRSFEFSGGYIMNETVKQNMVDGVTNMCPKLTNLSINYVTFTREQLEQLQERFAHLTCLDLSRCGICESSLEDFELDSERLKSIRVLKLAGNGSMTGSFFKSMKHVEVLDVSYCFNLSFFEFLKFLKICTKLVDLNVTGSCQVIPEDGNLLEILLQYQPNLERLNMEQTGVERDEKVLSRFRNLKTASFLGRKFGT